MDMERDSLYDDELNAEEEIREDEEAADEEYFDEDTAEEYEDTFEGEESETYEDEEESTEDDAEAEEDAEENDTTYFMGLFEFLKQALQSGTSVPLTTKKLVDTEQCFKILDDMQHNLPDGIQYGWKIYSEQNRILEKAESVAKAKVTSSNVRANSIIDEAINKANGIVTDSQHRAKAIVEDAEARANAMLEDAKQRAARMVSESEIMQRAKSEASIMIENAKAEAHERRLKAVNDAYRLLDYFEKQANGIASALNKKKNDMVGDNR